MEFLSRVLAMCMRIVFCAHGRSNSLLLIDKLLERGQCSVLVCRADETPVFPGLEAGCPLEGANRLDTVLFPVAHLDTASWVKMGTCCFCIALVSGPEIS